jgi:hypothetical protein
MGPYGRYHDDWLSSAFFLQVTKNDPVKVPDQKWVHVNFIFQIFSERDSIIYGAKEV